MRNRSSQHHVVLYDNSQGQRTALRLHAQEQSIEAYIGERTVPQPNGCWAYQGDLTKYGFLRPYEGGEKEAVHRFVYRLFYGDIAPDMHIHHRCENPGCINPKHLLEVTPGEHRTIHARLRRERKRAA